MAKFDENYFKTNDETPKDFDIDSLIGENEQKLWQGKPNKKAYVMSNVLKMLPFALIWLAVDGTMIGLIIKFASQLPVGAIIGMAVFLLFHLAPVWIWLYNIITASKRHKNIEYVFTDKRIIVKTGLIGIDVQNIYYSDIQSVNVKVGLFDKICKVGDIYIKCNQHAYVLWDLPNPYNLANKFQKIALDIKTDINYPNALRPDENTGYKTSYKAQDDTKSDDNLKF